MKERAICEPVMTDQGKVWKAFGPAPPDKGEGIYRLNQDGSWEYLGKSLFIIKGENHG